MYHPESHNTNGKVVHVHWHKNWPCPKGTITRLTVAVYICNKGSANCYISKGLSVCQNTNIFNASNTVIETSQTPGGLSMPALQYNVFIHDVDKL